MAKTVKNIKTFKVGDMKTAMAVHAAGAKATTGEIVAAMSIFSANKEKIDDRIKDLNKVLASRPMTAIVAELGAKPIIDVDMEDKAPKDPDGNPLIIRTTIIEKSVQVVDEKSILSLGSIVDAKYLEDTAIDYDQIEADFKAGKLPSIYIKNDAKVKKDEVIKDFQDAKLPSVLAPYVSAHPVIKTTTRRYPKTVAAASTTGTVSTAGTSTITSQKTFVNELPEEVRELAKKALGGTD